MSINLTDELLAKTKKGKIASAKQVFLEGDQENLQQIGEKTHQLEDAIKDITVSGGASTANAVSYNNETSGMTAVTAQGAIDELAAKNKLHDAEIAKKANAADVSSQMQTEQTRVNADLDKKFNKENIAQDSGEAEDKVMSQKAVSTKFSDLSDNIIGFSKSFTFDKDSNIAVSLDGVTLKKGQYAMILAKTTPAITTKYNGNANNMGITYPTISITDGFGEIILGPATSDGANLSQFGYNLISDVPIEHTTDFTILVMESADKIPVKALIQKNTEDIQKNTKDIQKNTEGIDEVKKYINKPVASFSKSINFSKDGKYVINFNSITFKKGQYARVLVKTTPVINTRYNGYATNMTESAPAIDIKDGMGELIVGPATEDNAFIGGFGYHSASQVPSDYKAEFTIEVMESADIPLKRQVEENIKEIQKNTEDITKIKKAINEPLISLSKLFRFDKESNYLVFLSDIKFKKGQYARVLVKTTPAISTNYAGYTTNMTTNYPSIKIKDGIGEIIIGPATSDNAFIGGFGYSSTSAVPSEHTAEFKVYPIDSVDGIPLKEVVKKNTEDIQKNTIQWQQEGIVQYPTSNEFSKGNFRVPGYTAIIRSWGFIGDSLCSGEMECYEGSVKKFVDMYEYSWGQQMCRLCGSEGYNYSQGGQTAKGWINAGERGWTKAKTTPHQVYIIALGVNDSYYVTEGSMTAGNIETDIDLSNYENNAETFAGYYGGIIQRIRSISSRSIIFVVSVPDSSNKLNPIIKAMPDKFKNVFLIDLLSISALYGSTEFNNKYRLGFHMNPAGYLYTAYLFMHYIDCFIQKNPTIFKDVALWNTNYTIEPTKNQEL